MNNDDDDNDNDNGGATVTGVAAPTFEVPTSRCFLAHDWKKTAQLPVSMLILPLISNLESSGDAFFVTPCGSDTFLLLVFQITVATSHHIKLNGLHDILLSFPGSVRSKIITHKFLLFVTPKHGGSLNKAQKIYTLKNKDAIVVPTILKGFQQCGYLSRHILG